MTPDQSSKLIEAAGGDRAFAEMIGIANEDGSTQRVNNWKRRGIPPQILLDHQAVIKRLEKQVRAAA
jgi:hypothetical protein